MTEKVIEDFSVFDATASNDHNALVAAIARGADVNQGRDGDTPITVAVRNRNFGNVQALIGAGANLDQ